MKRARQVISLLIRLVAGGAAFLVAGCGRPLPFVTPGAATRESANTMNRVNVVGFGYNCTWLAIHTEDHHKLAKALDLTDAKSVTWDEGVRTVYDSDDRVLVTPPIRGWTFVVGPMALPGPPVGPDDLPRDRCLPLLKRLGRDYGDVQYFASHHVVEFHAWARVKNGQVIRAYSFCGDQGGTVGWRVGEKTADEVALGFRFFDPVSPEANDDAYWDREDLTSPTEQNVMDLAARWSLDPSRITESETRDLTCLLASPPAVWRSP